MFSEKIELRKIETIIQNEEIYVLHFSAKVRENILGILMIKAYVIIRNFGVQ